MWLNHNMREGSARNGTEARETCEKLLAEYQQAQMAQQ
jgi:molybdenum-dependent DNA-binding transcriptional regulator ModE